MTIKKQADEKAIITHMINFGQEKLKDYKSENNEYMIKKVESDLEKLKNKAKSYEK